MSPDDPRHGTANGYGNLGCRCDPCRDAHAEVTLLAHKARRGSLSDDDPRHGTYNGYRNYGCRCAPCKAANASYARDYKRRRKTGDVDASRSLGGIRKAEKYRNG